jgi:hypothetical protein
MSDRACIRSRWPVLLLAAALSMAALVSSPSAAAKWGSNEPCVEPNGMTLKQQYGYSVAIVTPACTQIQAGQRWAPSVPWIIDSRFEQMPSGFQTDYATPEDDLRGKLQSIDVVVDPGSAYQSNRSYPADNKMWVGELPDAPGLPAVDSADLGSLDPLPVGPHSVAVYWNFTAQHCDGFSTSQGNSCLPAGRTLVKQVNFTVVDPYGGKAPDRLRLSG